VAKRLLVLLLISLTACVPSVPVPPQTAPTPRGASPWTVEPGDVIRLHVWLSPEQSGDLLVNERGQVLVPTVGRLNVAGLTPIAAEGAIVRGFANRLDSTRVEVTFLRPVSVVGGVKTPGVQLADPSTSVLSLLSRAGGPTRPGGDLRAYLLRIGEPVREISPADRVSDLGIRSTDQLYAQDPPFAVRNEIAIRTVTEVISILGSIVTIVLLITRQ
jgi:protein involved in polysaccharide export with SLBB domain